MKIENLLLILGMLFGLVCGIMLMITISEIYFISNSELGNYACSNLGLEYKYTITDYSSNENYDLLKYQIICDKPIKPIQQMKDLVFVED